MRYNARMQRYTTPIVSGHGRGKLLGYPTFNLVIPEDFDAAHGIYACWVWLHSPDRDRRADARDDSMPRVIARSDSDAVIPDQPDENGIQGGSKVDVIASEAWQSESATRSPQSSSDSFAMMGENQAMAENRYMGAMHYGPVPVFNQPEPSLEIFVLDWEDDGRDIPQLTFAMGPRLRDVMSFDTSEALTEQIGKDVEAVRTSLGSDRHA